MRTVTALLTLAALATAEDFTTDAARAAKAQYEADLRVARDKYIDALNQAAVKAAELGQLDEVVRIKAEKDRLLGKRAATPAQRVLWKHPKGYFERLNDGFWIERVGDGAANIFAGSTVNDEYIELARSGVLVRLFPDRSEVLFHGRDKGFKLLHRGGWVQR